MDFLKDIEDYHAAMENAYLFITKEITMDTVYEDIEKGDVSHFYSHFTETEDYEKCQELVNLKKNISKTPQD